MKIHFNKLFEVKVRGVKCDAPCCDYTNDKVTLDDYSSYVNKPCPKCGANLLTESDMTTINNLLKVEKALGWIRLPALSKSCQIDIKMDGTGRLIKK